MAGPTSKPFLKASLCGLVAFCLIAGAALAIPGLPANSPEAAELGGRLFAALAVASLMVGFFARRSRKRWSNWRFAGMFALGLLLTIALEIFSVVQR